MKTRCIKMVLFGVLVVALFGGAITLLWNALIPVIFGLPAINFWQALGLFVLTHLLFCGWGRGPRGFGMHSKARNHMREKWMSMTPEQRREMIERRRNAWHCGPFGREGFFGEGCFGRKMDQEPKKEDGPAGEC